MKVIVYLNDKELTIVKDKEYLYELDALEKGNVINTKEFNLEVGTILKSLKINRGIVGDDVKVYLNEIITPVNETFYKEVFSELGFNNVEVCSIKMFLEEKNTLYLIANKYSNFIYHDNNYYELSSLSVFDDLKFKNPIKIFGNNPQIKEVKNELKEKVNTKVYMFYPPENYILNLIKKIM